MNTKLQNEIGLKRVNSEFLFKSLFVDDCAVFKTLFQEYIFKINQQHKLPNTASKNCGRIVNLILKNQYKIERLKEFIPVITKVSEYYFTFFSQTLVRSYKNNITNHYQNSIYFFENQHI